MSAARQAGTGASAWPHCFLDHVLVRQRLRNDAELSRLLHLPQSSISKIRHGRVCISAEVMLRIHEAFGIPLAELKQLASHMPAARPVGG